MRALFTAHIEVEEHALNNVLRGFSKLIVTVESADSLQPREAQKPCDRPYYADVRAWCDVRCALPLEPSTTMPDVAGSGFHRALPEQPRENGDRPSSRILGSM